MNGYDWDFGFGFGRRYPAHRGGTGGGAGGGGARYGGEFRSAYDRSYGGGRGQRGGGGGYDRGLYGGNYPTYGGYPGGQREGMYYGGGQGQRGRQQQWGGGGGYDRQRGAGRGGGYDAGYARGPFLPDAVYRRHPELDRPPQRGGDRWPAQGHDPFHHVQRGDEEIEHAVRENLYQDSWVEADDLEVSVEDGVVTLRGEVSDYLQARYAWDDAWEAQGVRGVINQITVRTDLPADEHSTTLQTSGRGEAGG